MSELTTQIGDNCIIYLAKKDIDSDVIVQATNMCNHPAVKKPRIMPDCHSSNGCCIGFTCQITEFISPHMISGDIGCGLSGYPLDFNMMQKRKILDKINTIINNVIPMGVNINSSPTITIDQYDSFFAVAQDCANKFIKKYLETFNVDISSYFPIYNKIWLEARCKELRLDFNVMLRCMMSLGSGNHFIEVDYCEETQEYLLVVHTGSRLLGKAIYEFWCGELNTNNLDEDAEHVPFDKNLVLHGEKAYKYFVDMIFAQQFAAMNRTAIISAILCELQIEFDSKKQIQCIHNYIDFDDLILRKGAIKAYKNDICIVALNMRDGVILGDGLEQESWNYSCPHGAGRVVSRNSALKALNDKNATKFALKKFEKEMEGIVSSSICAKTLDERPSAYKEPNIVIESMRRTITNLKHFKTLVVAKGQ